MLKSVPIEETAARITRGPTSGGNPHKGREFSLKNVAKRFQGLTYKKLPDPLRRTLDNAFIQATIVDTDGSADSLEAVYQIFERLNSGGTQLTPHEIRVALYAGPLVDELARLNQLDSWRDLYGSKSSRSRDQELILRALALYMRSESYSRPLKTFLNEFVADHRDASDNDLKTACARFEAASALLQAGYGEGALRKSSKQVNAAQTEAVLVGLMKRLDHSSPSHEEVHAAVERLKGDPSFDHATSRSTADEDQVLQRLSAATSAFSA